MYLHYLCILLMKSKGSSYAVHTHCQSLQSNIHINCKQLHYCIRSAGVGNGKLLSTEIVNSLDLSRRLWAS